MASFSPSLNSTQTQWDIGLGELCMPTLHHCGICCLYGRGRPGGFVGNNVGGLGIMVLRFHSAETAETAETAVPTDVLGYS